jgi:hypothetical protein
LTLLRRIGRHLREALIGRASSEVALEEETWSSVEASLDE